MNIGQTGNGTSNATNFTITLPVTAVSEAIGLASIVNNSGDAMGVARIRSSDYTILSIYNGLTNDYTAFANSGSKSCRAVTITYEAA